MQGSGNLSHVRIVTLRINRAPDLNIDKQLPHTTHRPSIYTLSPQRTSLTVLLPSSDAARSPKSPIHPLLSSTFTARLSAYESLEVAGGKVVDRLHIP